MFFFLKIILITNVAEKNILILVEENFFYLILVEGIFFLSDSEFLSYNLMLNFSATKKKIILTLGTKQKNHNPPLKLNGRSLILIHFAHCIKIKLYHLYLHTGIENYIWIETLLRGHLSYKATLSLSQRWPLNRGLTVLCDDVLSATSVRSVIFIVSLTSKTDCHNMLKLYCWKWS